MQIPGRYAVYVTLGLLLLLAGGCHQNTDPQHHRHPTAAEESSHQHEHQESSDLDRPVEELFRATCEHGIKTYLCDECRYEVGVVKVPRQLFDQGLLERVTAAEQTLPEELQLTGELAFDDRLVAHLAPRVAGVVRRVHVTAGDRVKAGQPLVTLEAVALGEAQAAWLESRALLELTKRNHARLRALRREGIASERELLESEKSLAEARIRSQAATQRLLRLGMTRAAIDNLPGQQPRGRLVLRSPVAGTVLRLHAVGGELAAEGKELATVGDNSRLWLWADLYERDYARLQAALSASADSLAALVRVRAFAQERFPASLEFVSPAMDETTRTVRLRLGVANPAGKLLAGMFTEVTLLLPGSRRALAVPAAAVLEDEGREFVFVPHQDDFWVRRPVVTGRRAGTLVEITSGLAAGTTVMGRGAFLLKSDVLRSKMGAGCAD